MTDFDGMNGWKVFDAEDVPVGRVSGSEYGYKNNLLVTVSVRMERLARQEEYETTQHVWLEGPLDFSISTGVWMPNRSDIVSGGTNIEPLKYLVKYENGFNETTAWRLAVMGVDWHMNGMRAGCAHQVQGDAGLDSPKCPVTGYRWGSKWLVEPLPEGFLEEVKAIFEGKQRGVRGYAPGRIVGDDE